MLCDGVGRDFIAMSWPLPSARDQLQLTAMLISNDAKNIKLGMDALDIVASALLMGLSKASMARAPDDRLLASNSLFRGEEIGEMPKCLLLEEMLQEGMIGCLPGRPTESLFGSSCNIPAPALCRATPGGFVQSPPPPLNRPASILPPIDEFLQLVQALAPLQSQAAAPDIGQQGPSAGLGSSNTLKPDNDNTEGRTKNKEGRRPAAAAASLEGAAADAVTINSTVPGTAGNQRQRNMSADRSEHVSASLSKPGPSPRTRNVPTAPASADATAASAEQQRRADAMAAALIKAEEKEQQAGLAKKAQKSRRKQTKASKKKEKPPPAAPPSHAEAQQPTVDLHAVSQIPPTSGPVQHLESSSTALQTQLQQAPHSQSEGMAGFASASKPAVDFLQPPEMEQDGMPAPASVQGPRAEQQSLDRGMAEGSWTPSSGMKPQEAALPALHGSCEAQTAHRTATKEPEQSEPPLTGMAIASAGSLLLTFHLSMGRKSTVGTAKRTFKC